MVDNSDAVAGPGDRQAGRSPVKLVVDYDSAEDLIADYAQNLSSGEVFLETSDKYDVGTPVRLVLSFPGLLKPITIAGTVRWARPGDPRGAPDDEPDDEQAGARPGGMFARGVGVELDPGDNREVLRDAVERVRQRDPRTVSRLVRILVVEDNPHVAQLIRNGLHGTGRRQFGEEVAFNFRTAVNGRDALDVLRNERFDVLIVDVYLPIMDGANLIREVRADDHLCQLPVVAVSAGGQSARNAAMTSGADVFLDKPMRLREIIDSIRKLVDLSGATGATDS